MLGNHERDINLPDGMYMVYPKLSPPISAEVVLTVLQTTTGGGTMLEGGVTCAPVDLNTGVRICSINEGDYVEIMSGALFHHVCGSCGAKNECKLTGQR